MKYTLLLRSLDPKPTRRELEEISVNVPSVARADCSGIFRDWFGIVTSGLSAEDAQAFQSALRAGGFATDIVPDFEIPTLHPDFRCQRVDIGESTLTLTTAMNRRQQRDIGDLVFIAAGFVEKEKMVTNFELEFETRGGSHGRYDALVQKRVTNFEGKSYFRIDLFFSTGPHRVSLEIEKDTVMFFGDRPLRLKNTTELTVLMVDLQKLIPPERMNLGLRELSQNALYPTMHAYEEELRWMFYRLGAKG